MKNLPPGVLRYLLIGKMLIPIFFNLPINLVIGLLLYTRPTVSTWTLDGAAVDTLATCYLLPVLTCLIDTLVVRWQAQRGLLPQLAVSGLVRWFRGPLLWRAIKFGIATLALLAGPVLAAYNWLAGEAIPTAQFLLIKVTFAVALGILVTPLSALVALTDGPRKPKGPPPRP